MQTWVLAASLVTLFALPIAVLAGDGSVADGLFGVDQRPRFREYAIRHHPVSFAYGRKLRIGTILPERGVIFHDVPAEYGVRAFRYTIVDHKPVLVDPTTRRVVDILE